MKCGKTSSLGISDGSISRTCCSWPRRPSPGYGVGRARPSPTGPAPTGSPVLRPGLRAPAPRITRRNPAPSREAAPGSSALINVRKSAFNSFESRRHRPAAGDHVHVSRSPSALELAGQVLGVDQVRIRRRRRRRPAAARSHASAAAVGSIRYCWLSMTCLEER